MNAWVIRYTTRHGLAVPRGTPVTCPLCRNETNTSLCATCAKDLADLGITDLPDPDATADEVRAWAQARGVSVFSCRAEDITP